MAEAQRFLTQAVGRFVSGSLTEPRTTDVDNRPIPEEKQQYSFGFAIAKNDPWFEQFKTQIYQYAASVWAHDAQKLQKLNNWWTTLDGLSMKISDGDKPNRQGKVNQNTAGHYVIWFSSKFAFKTCVGEQYAEIPPEDIKRGYYIRVAGNFVDNGQAVDRAGIYMNGEHIQLIAEGDVIEGGVDAATAFAGSGVPAQLPPGARPLGSNVGMVQPPMGNPPAPVHGQTAPVTTPVQTTPQPPAPPQTVSPSNPPQPYPQITQPQQPQPPAPPQPPAAPGQPVTQPPMPPGVPQ